MLNNDRTIKYNKRSFLKNRQGGMTLVELLVVLLLFILTTGISIFDYEQFRSNTSLQNLANDIALSVRQTQNYAIGVQNSAPASFGNGYGIHFSTDDPSANAKAGSNKAFVVYTDFSTSNVNKYDFPQGSSTNCATTPKKTDECVNILNITSYDHIYQICYPIGGSTCSTPGTTNWYADITFLRPNPDAYICTGVITSGVDGTCTQQTSGVDIKIINETTLSIQTISISPLGQISIQ